MKIAAELVRSTSRFPLYTTAGAAGADVFSDASDKVTLHPGQSDMIPLGFKAELPEGYVALLLPRSGLGVKQGIVLGNLVGVIDSDFRHEWQACLWNRNLDGQAVTINPGDRVGQIVVVPVVQVEFFQGKLSKTDRGEGFGSSGK